MRNMEEKIVSQTYWKRKYTFNLPYPQDKIIIVKIMMSIFFMEDMY